MCYPCGFEKNITQNNKGKVHAKEDLAFVWDMSKKNLLNRSEQTPQLLWECAPRNLEG